MKILIIILLLVGEIQFLYAQREYYVTKTGNGNFSSIKEVNENMHIFKPGDKILFKRTENFTDAKLKITVSGENDNPIIFGAYGEGNKPILHNKNYEFTSWLIEVKGSYIVINNIEIIGSRWVKLLKGSNNVTVDRCYFHHYKPSDELEADANHTENEPLLVKSSDYFVLKNSDIRGNYNSVYQDMIVITNNSQFTLIENNYIDGGAHTSLYFRGYFSSSNDKDYNDNSPHHQIIKNNHFYNHSHHVLTIQRGAWETLIEGNYFERAGTGIDSSSYYNRTYATDKTMGAAIYFYGDGICRNNIIKRSGRGGDNANRAIDHQVRYGSGDTRNEIFDQAIYNNSFWGNYFEGVMTGIYIASGQNDNLKYENISFVNNAFGGSIYESESDFWFYKSGTSINYLGDYRNNSFENPYIKYGSRNYKKITITDFNSSPIGKIVASGNLQSDPLFKNPDKISSKSNFESAFNNFSLTPNSPLIDKGTFLTFTIGSGNNKHTIRVKDAKYFIDGWGIIDGDNIQIGKEILKITQVDYINNILTVDRNVSWNENTGIALPYSGNKPDIGAVEYTGVSNERKEKTNTPQTPIITQQPVNQSGNTEGEITFSVSATCNDSIGYQWWKTPFVSVEKSKIVNGSKYSGATTNTLTIKNIDGSDNGQKFVCEVYNTQDHNNHWINSEAATILVTKKQSLISNSQSNIKVFLEGALQGNKMKTTLLNNGYLPINQPFNISPYNFAAFQKVNAFPNTIVDWVLIELRSGLTTKAKRFAALLNNDGHVLNIDGSNNFSNQNIPDGNYYLVIYHRNHLPVMSSSIISIKNSVINYDFTTDINKAYGENALIKLPNGKFAMYAGDGDKNKKINEADYTIIKNNIFSTGYKDGDIDMNGIVNVLDYSLINKNMNYKSNLL